MIRKISKIVALILIATSISTISPAGIANISAKADTTAVTSSASSIEDAYAAVAQAQLVTKLSGEYSSVHFNTTTDTVSQFDKCGTLSYTLSDAKAQEMADTLNSTPTKTAISTGLTGVYRAAQSLSTYGPTAEYKAKGEALKAAVLVVEANLAAGVTADSIKEAAKSIPVYKYTVKRGASVLAQGFAVGGPLGLVTYPSDTYNGVEKDAEYNSIAVIPSLPLSGNSAYGELIDLNATGVNIICDGLNINILDANNNKVYVINNPVYKMLKVPIVAGSATPTANYYADNLNKISFSGVTNLKGFTSSMNLSSQGMSTTVLGLSLTTSDSKSKNYKYTLPVENYERQLLNSYIESMNLSTIGDTIKGVVTTGAGARYVMIPDINSEVANLINNSGIGTTINNVTKGLDEVSDSLDDLSDSLKDKNDDLDDAWDKVFDRFDNSEGWGKKDGYTYYYDKDGVSLKGVQKINGKTYYFNRIDGAMETGWQIVDGKRCYFDKKKGYELFNQWIQDGEDYYFVGDDGTVKKMDWINVGGKDYYLKADGKMAKNWIKVDDYWYCFNSDGSMVTSTWKYSKDKWYYLKDNGQAATSWLRLGDKWYYFKDPSGELQTGWFRADGSWYCSNNDGSMKTGWASSNDGVSYLDDITGKMKKNEWVTVDGKTYYFNINGIMVTGSRYIDGTKYVFNSDGTLS